MSEFLYIYRGEQQTGTPEQLAALTQKWITWVTGLGESGHLVNRGQSLEHGGKVVDGKRNVVTDGPYAETKDLVGGFSLIEAQDLVERTEW